MKLQKNDCNDLFIRKHLSFISTISDIFLLYNSFNGEVNEKADSDITTHILVSGDCRDILALQDACPNAWVINVEWLDACISQGTKVDTENYEL